MVSVPLEQWDISVLIGNLLDNVMKPRDRQKKKIYMYELFFREIMYTSV